MRQRASPGPTGAEISKRLFFRSSLVVAIILLLGIVMTSLLKIAGAEIPSGKTVYYYLYLREVPMMGLLAIMCVLSGYYLWQGGNKVARFTSGLNVKRWIWLIAAGSAATTAAGALGIFHNYPLAMDEYLSDFQARIFSSGQVRVHLPVAEQAYESALTPTFVSDNPNQHTWISSYLPVYSAIRLIFYVCGVSWATNAVLSAGSILTLAAVVRQLWPKHEKMPLVAAMLLGTSAQFLVNGMTSYAAPAHLFFNLLWLHLYLKNNFRSLLALPWVGVLAIGLHQPIVHALFVTPFLVRMWLGRRWLTALYIDFVYAVGCAGWILWRSLIYTYGGASPQSLTIFDYPHTGDMLLLLMNVALGFSWQSAALVALFAAGFGILMTPGAQKVIAEPKGGLYQEKATRFYHDLCGGVFLTFMFYIFFPATQGHGWGYRYAFAVLGNMVLIALLGWKWLLTWADGRRAARWFWTCAIVAMTVQFPWRCMEAEQFTRPFARGWAYVQSIRARYVVVDPNQVWYGCDFVRNDPLFKQTPMILALDELSDAQIAQLRRRADVHFLTLEELVPLGLKPCEERPQPEMHW